MLLEDDSIPSPYAEAIRQLQKRGWTRMRFANNYTLLHWGARAGKIELCKYFLNAGADFSMRDDFGKSPLEYAIKKGHHDVVLLLKNLD